MRREERDISVLKKRNTVEKNIPKKNFRRECRSFFRDFKNAVLSLL
ncbi:hypothetical protein HMPREF9193_00782 [Treponema lecithinolyticum ATCC 700332]|uniref:Uncharacterized protein n=1 Tax=Treponema lecithinolyticum ATCC 700332 TaxID=1321815 RepID=A0ABN0NZZ0_TRELE|nr:hypothetical protein HMPREF9193_00782 [Treponema lecithinolyticum ATCC 700332]